MSLLKEKFDHETTTSTLDLFNSFLDLKMDEGDSITDHLSRFETSFSHIFSRCSESSRQEAIALKNFLSVEEVKVMCLFRSLPPSLDNVVDNLSTKDHLTYSIVNKRLLDLQHSRYAIDNSSSKAYAIGKPKGNFKGNSFSKYSDKVLECTWCKKYGDDYVGHTHTRCQKLQNYQKQKAKRKRASRDGNKAHLASGPSVISSEDSGISDLSEHKAFSSSSSILPRHWILDSGCTAHMTSRKELLTSIKPHRGLVTVANGEQVPVQGTGTLQIELRTRLVKLYQQLFITFFIFLR